MEIPEIVAYPGGLVDCGEVVLWCSDAGDGEPLTLIGGFTAGHHAFDFVRPHLSRYRTLTWEPRGLGASDCPDPATHEYGAEVWARDLAALLDARGVDRTHLWAVGFGNYIGVRFAAEYPERVGGFVGYTDTWAGDPAKAYDRIWNVYRAIVENFGTKGIGARMLAGIFDVPVPWFAAWEARNVEEVLHPETVAATVGYGLTQADVRDDLERIEAPMLVVQGDLGWAGGKVAGDASLALMRERVRNLEVVVIPDAHPQYVLVQKPEECAAAVTAFLARHPLP
jgi:pimeloyl-ACP methyl ester carboxylesterase